MARIRISLLSFLVLTSLVFTTSLPAAPASRYIRYTRVGTNNFVYLRDVARYYGMQIFAGAKTCELRSRYSRLQFTYHKRKGVINNVLVHYLRAPFLSGSQPLISEQDFLLVVDPILRHQALRKHRMGTIMIDAGHGGNDDGGKGSIYREKDITLKLANQLRDMLRRRGYRVIMTRSSDRFLSLQQRTQAWAKYRPDLFVSIHCNIAGARAAKGIETFRVTPAGAASTADRKPSSRKDPGNAWDRNNTRLAYNIQKRLLQRTGASDRGIKHARFFVVRNVACPAVLIETGFLSNYAEQLRLGKSSYQAQIVQAIMEGIVQYHRDLVKK